MSRVPFYFLNLLSLFASVACQKPGQKEHAAGAAPASQPSTRPTPAARLTRIDLHLPDIDGLSGLATDGTGAVWAVPERRAFLLELSFRAVERRLPVVGLPDDVDLEALAWLAGSRFAIGTESNEDRATEFIFIVNASAESATVVDRIEIPYADLPNQAEGNGGIEGLCSAGGHLLVAFEPIVERAGARHAVVVDHQAGESLRVFEVPLTTPTGKISALDCRLAGDRIETLAIERHFGVHRVVTFEVPLRGDATVLTPRVLVPLEGLIGDRANPEGIVWKGNSFIVVLDNHYRVRTGENELLRIEMP